MVAGCNVLLCICVVARYSVIADCVFVCVVARYSVIADRVCVCMCVCVCGCMYVLLIVYLCDSDMLCFAHRVFV